MLSGNGRSVRISTLLVVDGVRKWSVLVVDGVRKGSVLDGNSGNSGSKALWSLRLGLMR